MDLTGAVLLVLTAGAFVYLWVASTPEHPVTAARLTMTLTATWTDAAGVQHKVTTTQGASEPYDVFQARHDAAVAAMLAKYPPAGS